MHFLCAKIINMFKQFQITVFLFLIACSVSAQVESSPTQKLKKMEWLLGNWNRTNTKPDRTAHEHWEKKSDTEWAGVGVNMRGSDTVFVEKLKIVIEKGKLFYVADVPENKKLVYFEITSVKSNGFVCENPQHDFPKKIEYQLEGDKLLATISGGEKKIEYFFVRKK